MRDLSGIVGLEFVDDLPVLSEYADRAISRAEKEIIGAGADACNVVAFEELAGLGLGR